MALSVGKPKPVRILTCGGTFDMLPDTHPCQFNDPSVANRIVSDHLLDSDVTVCTIFQKDSSDMGVADRHYIVTSVRDAKESAIVVVQGTDTMSRTAEALRSALLEKTVVLTGSFSPATLVGSDGPGNLIAAVVCARALDTGIYLVIQGDIFVAGTFVKDRDSNRFVRPSNA